MNFNLKNLPKREKKPRSKGITMVIDKGSSVQQCKNLIESMCWVKPFFIVS